MAATMFGHQSDDKESKDSDKECKHSRCTAIKRNCLQQTQRVWSHVDINHKHVSAWLEWKKWDTDNHHESVKVSEWLLV